MNIVGIGIDIIDIERIKKTIIKKRVAEFYLLKDELMLMNRSRNISEYLASRIACKEAVIKAFPGSLHYHDFKILKKGKKLHVEFIHKKNAKYKTFLSLSHEFKHAIGYAIMTL